MIRLCFLVLLLASSVHAKESWPIKISVSVLGESYSIQTKESSSTNQADAGFFSGQIVPSIGFFVHQKIMIGAQYNQSLMGEFGVSGIGAFGRYYFIGGPTKFIELENLDLKFEPSYSIYGGLAYKNLSIGAGDFDVRFNGIELSAGIEKHLTQDYFLFCSLNITQLSSSNNRTGLAIGAGGGIGYNY